jgi:hypothetical protein
VCKEERSGVKTHLALGEDVNSIVDFPQPCFNLLFTVDLARGINV